MSTANPAQARGEWSRYWKLPIAAALGYATSVIHIYGLGPFIRPISEEFGWSVTLTTVGLTISVGVQALFSVPIGLAVDRFGPRKLGLVGIILTCGFFALLSTATGDAANWFLLWGLLALAVLPVQATIWTSAVASRFESSRGLAFAITLCGAGLAQAVFPWMATQLMPLYGWRMAIAAQGLVWLIVAFPIIFLFFRGARDAKRGETVAAAVEASGMTFGEGLRSSVYLRLLLASGLFTFIVLGFVVHFVPILTGRGVTTEQAGAMAAVIGLISIAGRLGTGFLLDRLPASLVGATAFAFPAAGAALMLLGPAGANPWLAAILIGLTLGAEVDVIVYLVTKHFGLRSFGALYGGLLAALSIGTAFGPLAAAKIFDETGSYEMFLWLTIPVMLSASLALLTLPRPKYGVPEA